MKPAPRLLAAAARCATLAVATLVALAVTLAPHVSRAGVLHLPGCSMAGSDSAGAVPRPHLLVRRDLWFALGAAAAVAATASQDRELTDRIGAGHPDRTHDFARAAKPFGDPVYVLPALALVYGAGRISDRPGLACSSERIGLSVIGAGAIAFGLKLGAGRARPSESPNDALVFEPFSSHDSFPSGHSSIAFSTAAAIDRETKAKWVPWVVYPAATVVAWSRVHDRQHWSSDVVAGAAIGWWAARKAESFLRAGMARD